MSIALMNRVNQAHERIDVVQAALEKLASGGTADPAALSAQITALADDLGKLRGEIQGIKMRMGKKS